MPLNTAPPAARDSPARSPELTCTAMGAACTRRLVKTPRDRQTARTTAVFLILVVRDAAELPIFTVSPFPQDGRVSAPWEFTFADKSFRRNRMHCATIHNILRHIGCHDYGLSAGEPL